MNRMKEAIILAVGLIAMGWCIKCGIDNFANKDRFVTVKGLPRKAGAVIGLLKMRLYWLAILLCAARVRQQKKNLPG